MVDYVVRYTLLDNVYETVVRTSTSGAAILWVETQVEGSTNITIVG